MQTIVVTGANRGLGLEFARQYLARGERVFACCRVPERAVDLAALGPERLTVVRLDVTSEQSIVEAFEQVEAETAGVDVLVNNAGVHVQGREKLGMLQQEDGARTFAVNAIAPVLIAQQFLPLLKRAHAPKVASISSGYGALSKNTGGFPYHYSASKAALNMYMRSFAADTAGMGITTVILTPGWVRTDMGGRNATLSAEESVSGMIRVIDRVTVADNGRFYTWQDQEREW